MAFETLYQLDFCGLAFIRAYWRNSYPHLLFIFFNFIVSCIDFDWKKELHVLEKNSRWYFIARKYLCFKNKKHIRASSVWCNYFEFFLMSNWRVFFRVNMKNFNQSLSWIFFYLNCRFVPYCHLVYVAHLSLRYAQNTMGTRGTLEWHPGLVAPMVRKPKCS